MDNQTKEIDNNKKNDNDITTFTEDYTKFKTVFENLKRMYDFNVEQKRFLYTKANNLIGYTTIIIGLLVGFGTYDFVQKTSNTVLFFFYFLGIGSLIISLVYSLLIVKVREFLQDFDLDEIDKLCYDNQTTDFILIKNLNEMLLESIRDLSEKNRESALNIRWSWIFLIIGIIALVGFIVSFVIYNMVNTEVEKENIQIIVLNNKSEVASRILSLWS